jgi:glycosyltransferase involved in cell wall biosynthesis
MLRVSETMNTDFEGPRKYSDDLPRVSVIIPAYNSADSIAEGLASVFAQTFSDFEVIVINDGSRDTEKLETTLEQFGNKVKYLKHENRGAAAARNSGLRIARGELIAFLDADDRWFPTYLEEQLALLRKNAGDVVYADGLIVGEQKPSGVTFMDLAPTRCEVTPESLLLVDVGILTSGVVARKSLIYEVDLFDETIRRGHDFDLWLRLAQRKAKFVCNKKVLLYYTNLGQGLSGNAISQLERRLELLSKIRNRGGLSSPQELALLSNEQECAHRLLLEKGKAELLKKNFAGARNYFNEAAMIQSNWKLKAVNLALSVAPTLLWRFLRARERDSFALAPLSKSTTSS